jgi:hypothetical protein
MLGYSALLAWDAPVPLLNPWWEENRDYRAMGARSGQSLGDEETTVVC